MRYGEPMMRWIAILLLTVVIKLGAAEPKPTEAYTARLALLQAQLAAAPTNTALLLRLGDLCHDQGIEDDREAVKLAEKYLLRLLELEPTNALARAFYGSTLTMKGRDAFWPTTRVSLVKSGNREMDAAVKLAPDDVKVRFTRANNNYYMPKFLDRVEIVEADFDWLWQQVKAGASPRDNFLRQTVARRQGQLLAKKKKLAEALPIWRQGLEFDPQSALARELSRDLEKNKEKP